MAPRGTALVHRRIHRPFDRQSESSQQIAHVAADKRPPTPGTSTLSWYPSLGMISAMALNSYFLRQVEGEYRQRVWSLPVYVERSQIRSLRGTWLLLRSQESR